MLVVDGPSDVGGAVVEAEVTRASGVAIVGVGVGNGVDVEELRQISSGHVLLSLPVRVSPRHVVFRR